MTFPGVARSRTTRDCDRGNVTHTRKGSRRIRSRWIGKQMARRSTKGRYAGRTSWMLDLLARRVTCRGSRERARGRGSEKGKERGKERERKWVECAPRRRVVQVGDRRVRLLRMAYTGGAFATGILDPRLEGSLSRIRHAGAASTLSLFLLRRYASSLSVPLARRLPAYRPAGASSPAPAYSRGWLIPVRTPTRPPAAPPLLPLLPPLLTLPLPADIWKKTRALKASSADDAGVQ